MMDFITLNRGRFKNEFNSYENLRKIKVTPEHYSSENPLSIKDGALHKV